MMNAAVMAMLAKAQPTLSDVYVSVPLQNVSVGYFQKAIDFVFWQAFPMVSVGQPAGQYPVWNKGDLLRSVAQVRAPGDPTPGMGAKLTWASYATEVYGVHFPVADQIVAAEAQAVKLEMAATRSVTQQMLMLQEIYWTAAYFTAGVWSNESSPNDWDQSTGTPLLDIETQINARHAATGKRPNTLILGPGVWTALKTSADVRALIQYSQGGIVTRQLLAGALEIDRVLVAYGVRNSAAEGATDSVDFITGNHALLCYVNPQPSLFEPSAGYTFTWNGYLGATETGYKIKRFRDEKAASWLIEAEAAFNFKLVADDCAHFFDDCLA